ncbi:GNAT family N-acetyltransferase/peptidase C39 family protein [Aestuariibacter salexigens]|uniref:GNAT family N-acetyltransferase/peptidase C39 family protein n=1 Tax=Aestuariibacter salexigens TaxID=226010 RepID=UPI00041611C2|nr:GNAT family N-acetyltransferase/peptidase C39 family protein [Aestuariibacter salexigens]
MNTIAANATIRIAQKGDISALYKLEQRCFTSDRLSKRSFTNWVDAPHGLLMVSESAQGINGYALVWCRKGTRLARLYSLAVDPDARGQGVAHALLDAVEQGAVQRGRLFMRLEVSETNHGAISLYKQHGYKVFGEYPDYYDDHADALRMQKCIHRGRLSNVEHLTPWYPQHTEFTCGPAALLMAMASLQSDLTPDLSQELAIWREATTIFMTSGHGGCHPVGLALAAAQRGFRAKVFMNITTPLFVDGVRDLHKKQVMTLVHNDFVKHAEQHAEVDILYQDVDETRISECLKQGMAVLLLISTYRLDGRKAPHWVTVTGMDEQCFFVNDPDVEDDDVDPLDCQHIPIAKEDMRVMSQFGSGKLKTAIALQRVC